MRTSFEERECTRSLSRHTAAAASISLTSSSLRSSLILSAWDFFLYMAGKNLKNPISDQQCLALVLHMMLISYNNCKPTRSKHSLYYYVCTRYIQHKFLFCKGFILEIKQVQTNISNAAKSISTHTYVVQ